MAVEKLRAAIGRGARTGVVAATGFALGHWLLANTDIAVFATFTGLALTGIADFGGTIPARSLATAAAAVVGVALTALGTWASTEPLAIGVAVMLVATATVSYSSVLGGYAAAGAIAVTLFYLVAAGSPAPLAHLPDRLAGVIVGAVLATGAGALPWPQNQTRTVNTELAASLEHLAVRLEDPGRGTTPGPPVRQVIDSLVERPSAPTRPARAALYLVNDLERLQKLADRLDRADTSESRSARQTAAAVLSDCADALRHSNAEAVPTTLDPVLRGYGPADRLSAVTSSAAVHCSEMLNDQGPSVTATLDHAQRRWRAHFTFRSVHARDALRTGIGLAAACAIAGGFDLAHGFWVAFATLTVLRTSLRGTARRVGAAIAGTVGGCAASFAVVDAVGVHTAIYAALLPVVIALAIAANVGVGFLAGQVGFTVAIVVLFNLLAPAGSHIGVLRVQDVTAGALTGVVVGALAWPRGARAELPAALGDLTRTANDYLAAAVRALGHDTTEPTISGRLDRARRPALAAAVRSDSTFSQYLAEAPQPDEAAAWATAVAAAHRLWYAADLLRISGVRTSSSCRDQSHDPSNADLLDWLNELTTPAASPTNEATQ